MNLNLLAVMLVTTALEIRVRKILLLYFRLYSNNHDKLVRMTVFHCEHTATQNIMSFLLALHVSIFTQRSATISPPHSSQKNYHIPCLQQLYISEFELLSGLSVYWNNIFIQSSNELFLRCTIKASVTLVCKNYSGKNKRQHHRNLPNSETISRVSFTWKQPWQYSNPTPRPMAIYIYEWRSYTAFLYIYFLKNRSSHRKCSI